MVECDPKNSLETCPGGKVCPENGNCYSNIQCKQGAKPVETCPGGKSCPNCGFEICYCPLN